MAAVDKGSVTRSERLRLACPLPQRSISPVASPSPVTPLAQSALNQPASPKKAFVPLSIDLSQSILKKELSSSLRPDAKLFAHIAADAVIEGTDLEGSSVGITSAFRLKQLRYLNGIKKISVSERLNEFERLFEGLKITDPAAQAKAVAGLKVGERFLIDGGWEAKGSRSGHAMIYEFVRRENGNFDIYIDNTGSGVQFHEFGLNDQKIMKFKRTCKYEDVLPEELSLSRTPGKSRNTFFQVLNLMKNHTYGTEETDENEIYLRAFGHIASKKVDVPSEIALFATIQRSGTCAERVLNPLTYRHLFKGDIRAYKRAHFYLNYYAAIGFFQNKEYSDQNLYLLKSGAAKCLRTTCKLYDANPENSLLSDEEMREAQATLTDILNQVQDMEKKAAKTLLKEKEAAPSRPKNDDRNFKYYFQWITGDVPPRWIGGSPWASPLELAPLKPRDLKVFFTPERMKKLDGMARMDQILAIHQIDHIIDAMPPVEQFGLIPDKDVPTLLDHLHDLMKLYANLSRGHSPDYPARQNRALSLLSAIYHLALRCDEIRFKGDARLKTFPVHLAPFKNSLLDPHDIFYRPEDFANRMKLLQSFPAPEKEQPALFAFEAIPLKEKVVKTITDGVLEGRFLVSHILGNPALRDPFMIKVEELQAKCKEGEYSEEALQIAAALAIFTDRDFLQSPDVGHLIKLRSSFLFAHLFMMGNLTTSKQLREDFVCEVGLNKDKELVLVHRHSDDRLTIESDGDQRNCYYQHPQSSCKYNTLLSDKSFKREKNEILKEGPAIGRENPVKNLPYGDVLAATNCEPSLQPTKLIAYYEQHLSDFAQTPEALEEVQFLFDRLFFKVSVADGKTSVPLFEEIRSSAALQKQCCDFISKGLDLYWTLQPAKRPLVPVCLFFVRLAIRLAAIHPEMALPPVDTYLNEWLKSDQLSSREKAAIQLHRILLLGNRPVEKLSQEALAEGLASWFYYNQHRSIENTYLHLEATQLIHSWSSQIRKSFKGGSPLFDRVLEASGLEPLNTPWEEIGYPVYDQKNDKGSYFSINVLSGSIENETGQITTGNISDGSNSTDYKRLFGNHTFDLVKSGKVLYFKHPKYGSIRMLKKSDLFDTWVIQRNWNGSWYQYIAANDVHSLPLPLIADHSHWISLSDDSKQNMQIFSLADPGNRIAYIDQSGVFDGKTEIEIGWQHKAEAPDPAKSNPFDRFDRKDCVLATHRNVSLPRFRSMAGVELAFSESADGWLQWDENPEFFLDAHQKGLLGKISNYLVLKGAKEERRLLVPMKPLQKQKTISRSVQLDVDDSYRYGEYEKDGNVNGKLSPQNGVHTFFEYRLKGDKLIPLNMEGTLYYAYLLLSQKNYSEALALLRSIGIEESFSTLSLRTLEWIWELNQLNKDSSPSAQAVRLYACFLLQNHESNPLNGKAPEGELRKSGVAYEIYAAGLHYVPPELRLAPSVIRTLNLSSKKVDLKEREPKETALQLLQKNKLDKGLLKVRGKGPYRISNPIEWDSDVLRESSNSPLNLASSFGYYYQKVRTASTDLEKRQLLSSLYFYPIQGEYDSKYYGGSEAAQDIHSKILLSLIHFALLHPLEAPLLPVEPSTLQIEEWLTDCLTKAQKKINPDERIFSKPAPEIVRKPSPIPAAITKPLPLPPIPENPSFELSLPTLTGEDLQPLQLSKIAERFLEASGPKGNGAPVYDFTKAAPAVADLPDGGGEPRFDTAIQTELAAFQKDYKEGLNKRKKRVVYSLKAGAVLPDLSSKIDLQKKEVKKLEDAAIELVCKKAPTEPQRLYENSLLAGEAAAIVTMEDLVSYFLQGNAALYATLNPHLSKEEIELLDEMIYGYLIASTELAQAERSAAQIDELKDVEPDLKGAAIQQLGQTMSAKVFHDRERALLVFEHRSGFRLRENQVALIRRMLEIDPATKEYRDIVGQLMMGGGKTSAIASTLLETAAMQAKQKKRISLFIPPSAQFQSLRSNLANAQKKHYLQEVIPVDMDRAQMTLENLDWLITKLTAAEKEGAVLLIKAECLQSLQLEFLSLLMQKREHLEEGKIDQKILALQSILKKIASCSDAIIDELDVVLAPHKVVNFPIGSQTLLPPEYVFFLHKIALLHVSDTLKFEWNGKTISVNEFLRLREKREAGIDVEFYKKTIQPLLVDELFRTNSFDLMLPSKMKESFRRFLLGEMKLLHLTPDDAEFLAYLKKLHESGNEEEKEAAQLIALSKGIFREILPSVIPKEVNRNFGRTRGEPAGKVIPFLGADAPARTEFGNPWEAALFHYFTALRLGIETSQIKSLAAKMHESAEHVARKNSMPFDETVEAKDFLELTHVPLSQINAAGQLEKAVQYINADLSRLMLTEAETICGFVGYYSKYVSSNAQDLVGQLATCRTLSGTPSYRMPCYPASLKGNCELEEGVEGQIADQLLRTCKTIHTYKKGSIGDILQKALDGGVPKERLRGLIDAAGILKDYKIEQVAQEISEKLGLDVLFFGRRTHEDLTPDHLMLWRNGKAEYIGSTQAKVLEKHEIKIANTFVIYDDRHCEATDIPQKGDAINLLTIDERTPARTLFQAALRLRQFFEGQEVALMISEEARSKMPNGGKTVFDLIVGCLIYQAIDKSKEGYRSYGQKIDHVVRQEGIDSLLEGIDLAQLQAVFSRYESALVQEQVLDPYLHYGTLDEMASAIDVLKKKVESVKEKAADPSPFPLLMQDAEANLFFPSLVPQTKTNNLGQEIDVHCEVLTEVTVEVALEQSLQVELQYYNGCESYLHFQERKWKEDPVAEDRFPAVKRTSGTEKDCPTIRTLRDVLQYAPKWNSSWRSFHYKHPYHKIFDEDILITDNQALNKEEYLPVFSKFQKPAHQHLVIYRNGKLQVLMLSISDAAFFQQYLKEKGPSDLWLIHPNGDPISNHPHLDLNSEESAKLDRLLLQIQFFNGNAAYLDAVETEARAFLSEGHADLKHRFFKIKVDRDQTQRNIYYRGIAKEKKEKEKKGTIQYFLMREFQRQERAKVQALEGEDAVNALPLEKIKYLSPRQVPLLKKPELIGALQRHHLDDIILDQIPYLDQKLLPFLKTSEQVNRVPIDRIDQLVSHQFKQLSALYLSQAFESQKEKFLSKAFPEITGEQVEDVNQIAALPDNLIKTLKPSQIRQISIPFEKRLDASQLRLKYGYQAAATLICVGLMMKVVRIFAYLFGLYLFRSHFLFFRKLCTRLDYHCHKFSVGRRLRKEV